MPYELKKSGKGYKVFKKNSSKSFSKKPLTKEKAKSQLRALYAAESLNKDMHVTDAKFKFIKSNEDNTSLAVRFGMKSPYTESGEVDIVFNFQVVDGEADYVGFKILEHISGFSLLEGDDFTSADPELLSKIGLDEETLGLIGEEAMEKVDEHLNDKFGEANNSGPWEERFKFNKIALDILHENNLRDLDANFTAYNLSIHQLIYPANIEAHINALKEIPDIADDGGLGQGPSNRIRLTISKTVNFLEKLKRNAPKIQNLINAKEKGMSPGQYIPVEGE